MQIEHLFQERGEPCFINELGVKWWRHVPVTRYAHDKGFGETAQGWLVERPDGYKTYLLTKDGVYVTEDQIFEVICVKIDMLGLVEERCDG